MSIVFQIVLGIILLAIALPLIAIAFLGILYLIAYIVYKHID